MTIRLDTGLIQTSPHLGVRGLPKLSSSAITEFNDTTPAEVVVFPSEERRLLLVEPSMMMVVTGYNLSAGTKIIFRKVLRSNGIPAQGTADCCPSVVVAHTIRLHSTALPCWCLDGCNPVFVIKTPGSYEFDVEGDVADVVVTAMSFAMQEVNHFSSCDCILLPSPPHSSSRVDVV